MVSSRGIQDPPDIKYAHVELSDLRWDLGTGLLPEKESIRLSKTKLKSPPTIRAFREIPPPDPSSDWEGED